MSMFSSPPDPLPTHTCSNLLSLCPFPTPPRTQGLQVKGPLTATVPTGVCPSGNAPCPKGTAWGSYRKSQTEISCTQQAAANTCVWLHWLLSDGGCLAHKNSLLLGTQHICTGVLDKRKKPLLGEYLGVILTRGKKAFLVGLRSGTADTPVLACAAIFLVTFETFLAWSQAPLKAPFICKYGLQPPSWWPQVMASV